MKISRSSQYQRRRNPRNPLFLPAIILIALVAGSLAWFWHRGGPQPQQHVETVIPAERLGR